MTAILIGRLPKANLIVADAMVQNSFNVTSYKDCKLKDKITNINPFEQYFVLCGEELINFGVTFLNTWCQMKKIKLNLFIQNHFEEVLNCALKCRQYSIDISKAPIIDLEKSDVYIVDRSNIKYYEVKFENEKYIISKQEMVPGNTVLLNYKGVIKSIDPPSSKINYIEFGIEELNKEHIRRKTKPVNSDDTPLDYDFENKFSSVLIQRDTSLDIERNYPFDDLTEIFLTYGNDWGYITDQKFRYSPNLN